MTDSDDVGSPVSRRMLRFALLAAAIAWVIGLLGWLPVRNWVGDVGPPALWAACAASWVASMVGALPMVVGRRAGEPIVVRALAATGLRLITTLVLGLVFGVGFGLEPRVLLVGLAVSYAALLAVDTWFALGLAKADSAVGSTK
ncbi:MAG: hypothetical protein AAF481_05105 [Acidobacteriota bacterium]